MPSAAQVDRDFFYKNFPSGGLNGKTATANRKRGFNAIFDAWDADPKSDRLEWLAYLLATAWHETGAQMLPVREGFAKTDAGAVKAVTAYCKKEGIKNYAERAANGKSYYGRGYVQLTHAANYRSLGKELGVGDDLVDEPDKVLNEATGAKILKLGLTKGKFRPAAGKLKDYFDGASKKWSGARALVNGDGKKNGAMVGDYGKAFFKALKNL